MAETKQNLTLRARHGAGAPASRDVFRQVVRVNTSAARDKAMCSLLLGYTGTVTAMSEAVLLLCLL